MKKYSISRTLLIIIFISGLMLITGISLFIHGKSAKIKRTGIFIGALAFAIDNVCSILLLLSISKSSEKDKIKGMLLWAFGFPSPTEIPDDWQEWLKRKARELEEREFQGGTLSAEDFVCRGIALCLEKNYASAVSAFEKAGELEPSSAYAWLGKGLALFKLGYYESALDALDRATEFAPSDEEILKIREEVYRQESKERSD